MKKENTQKPSKPLRKKVKEWVQATVLSIAMCGLHMAAMAAPGWATEANTSLNTFITGLKWVGGGIATILLIWIAYEIMWGGKRLQDCKNWIIGAMIFASSGHIVDMFFGSGSGSATRTP